MMSEINSQAFDRFWPTSFMRVRFFVIVATLTLSLVHEAAAQESSQPKQPLARLGEIEPESESKSVSSPPGDGPYIARQPFQRKVGQIQVQGNTVTKNRVVLQYLDLAPGDVADTTLLRSSQQNLISTRLFAVDFANDIFPRVEFAPYNDPSSEFQDILVTVQETQTMSFTAGGGVNSDMGVNASIVYNERNFDLFGFTSALSDFPLAFRGAGQELRVEVVPGTHMHRYQVSFREPRLLGLPIGIGGSGYYFLRDYSAYDEQRAGGDILVSHQFSSAVTGAVKVRIENVEVSDPADPTIPELAEALGGNFLTGIKLSLAHDTRDSHLRPSEGHFVQASVEQVVGTFNYPTFVLSGQQYWLARERPDGSGRHIIAGAAQVGFTGDNTPIYDRFYAGGTQTLRGFQFRSVSPVTQDVEVGGDFQLLASLEYQFPLSTDDRWFGVLFVDTGTVEQDIEISTYRVSLGAGLRAQLPILGPAPIAFDVAFPISSLETDDKQWFSIFAGFFR